VTVASPAFRDLATSSRSELEAALRRGDPPSIESLLGYEYRGFNRPASTALLGIRKFIKGFFPVRDEAFGFNSRVAQNGIAGEWIAKAADAGSGRYAFFGVAPVQPGARDSRYPQALLLDYARGSNPPYDPARLLRDYLVRVDEGSDDLLLGKAYLAVGPARVAMGFFILERQGAFEVGPELERRVTN
jgi:hypothetical protein